MRKVSNGEFKFSVINLIYFLFTRLIELNYFKNYFVILDIFNWINIL